MQEKIKQNLGRSVEEYVISEGIKINDLDKVYLSEIIDEEYFVCEQCKLPMHDSNSSDDDNKCTFCADPHLWKDSSK